MTKTFRVIFLYVFFCAGAAFSQTPVASVTPPFLAESDFPVIEKQAGLAAATDSIFLEERTATMPYFPDSDPAGTSLRILSSLFGVIIIAFAISWFIQKKVGIGSNIYGKVLGILPLDNKRLIYIVDIMGKVMILGVTDSNINLIGEITDKDTLDSLRLQYDKPSPGMDKLFSFLTASRQTESEKDSEYQDDKDSQHENRQQERHRKLSEMRLKRPDKDQDTQN